MKRNLLGVLVLLAMCVSCNNDDAAYRLEEITDSIRGTYRLKSATVLENELDLNGDGKVTNDMFAEFYSFGDYVLSIKVKIIPASLYNEEIRFGVDIPKQSVRYWKDTGKYEFEFVNFRTAYFYYSIDNGGNIIIKPVQEVLTDYSDEDNLGIRNICYRGDVVKSLTFNGNGEIELLMDDTCYDFASNQVINVPVKIVYERKSFSIN